MLPVINCFVIVSLTYSFISVLLIAVFLHPSSQEILQTKVKDQTCTRIISCLFVHKEHEKTTTHRDSFIVEFINFILHICWRILKRKHRCLQPECHNYMWTKLFIYIYNYLIWLVFIFIRFRIIAVKFLLPLCSRLFYCPLKWKQNAFAKL